MKKFITKTRTATPAITGNYSKLLGGVTELLEAARRASARTVNAFMTATYWEVGRRIVEFEQGGAKRAGYGEQLLKRLSSDLTARLGRGFSVRNLESMRLFYGVCGTQQISETLSRESASSSPSSSSARIPETPSPVFQRPRGRLHAAPFNLADVAHAFPLP